MGGILLQRVETVMDLSSAYQTKHGRSPAPHYTVRYLFNLLPLLIQPIPEGQFPGIREHL